MSYRHHKDIQYTLCDATALAMKNLAGSIKYNIAVFALLTK
jgi:hypothetical protein